MSSAPQPDDRTPQSTPAGRKRSRLIPLAFVAAIVLVMLFILLVQWVGR